MQTYVNRATATVAHSKSRRYTFITKVSLFAYIITFSHFTWNYIIYWNEIRWSFIWFRSLWYCLVFHASSMIPRNILLFQVFFIEYFNYILIYLNIARIIYSYNIHMPLFSCILKPCSIVIQIFHFAKWKETLEILSFI